MVKSERFATAFNSGRDILGLTANIAPTRIMNIRIEMLNLAESGAGNGAAPVKSGGVNNPPPYGCFVG